MTLLLEPLEYCDHVIPCTGKALPELGQGLLASDGPNGLNNVLRGSVMGNLHTARVDKPSSRTWWRHAYPGPPELPTAPAFISFHNHHGAQPVPVTDAILW